MFLTYSRPKQRKHSRPKPKPEQTQQDSGADTDSDVSVSELSDSDADIEDKYEKELADKPLKKTKPLLPIKTRQGVVEQEMEIDGKKFHSSWKSFFCKQIFWKLSQGTVPIFLK